MIETVNKPILGVNLGGWLVLEKWMTPSVFEGTDAVDEYSLMRTEHAGKRVERHRRTFITERDFQWLTDHHVELVRIPVGYWLFEDADGFTPTINYLDKAMQWADKYGIKVLIDLHAVRGSQNGHDHSGRVGDIKWFDNFDHIVETVSLLECIAERYKDAPALWGIELLNEPKLSKIRYYFILLAYYRRAYQVLSKLLPTHAKIVFHDAFHPLLLSGALPRKRAVMDVHWYGFSSREKDFASFIHKTAKKRGLLLRILQWRQPVVVGEWSGVAPKKFQQEPVKHSIDSQRAVYAKSTGHIFWTYKVENKDVWNFRHLTEAGD